MQTPEQLVCTREQSIRLQELGITAPSYFHHINQGRKCGWEVLPPGMWDVHDDAVEVYPAWTAAEILEYMPDCRRFKVSEGVSQPLVFKTLNITGFQQYKVEIDCAEMGELADGSKVSKSWRSWYGETAASAVANMYIALLTDKFILPFPGAIATAAL